MARGKAQRAIRRRSPLCCALGPGCARMAVCSFHCDEALACFMLQHTAEFRGCPIVRSRDPKVLEGCTIVVDVGAVYDPAKHRYDHHQRGFAETLDDKHTMKLSSAGLVYKSVAHSRTASRAKGRREEAAKR